MQTIRKDPNASLPAMFMAAVLIAVCLLAFFFSSLHSASKNLHFIPATGLEDLGVITSPLAPRGQSR